MIDGSFFIQLATQQTEVTLMAECPLCGAITYVPLAHGYRARSVACGECGTRMQIGPDVLTKLKAQAAAAVAEMERLLAAQ